MSATLDMNGDMFSRGRRMLSRVNGHSKIRTRRMRALIDHVNGSSDLDAEILEELREERVRLIRATIANRNWEMHFQPIVDLKSGDAIGTEALSRFADRSTRAPDEWFAEAAEVGLGIELEVAALDSALEQLPQLPSNLYLSLNASVETIMSDDFAARIGDVPAERIVLELTEHTEVGDYANFGRGLESLRSQGVRLAVDDTGAGFASLQHVLNLQPDVIKLDVGLTRGIDRDPARRALGRALLTFGLDAYDASIVAEGIETEGELEVLRALGCPCGQGFYLGRPGRISQIRSVPHSHHLHVVADRGSAADLPLLMRELLEDLDEAEAERENGVNGNGSGAHGNGAGARNGTNGSAAAHGTVTAGRTRSA
jgi:EAL domain-containing protein (putative c-di-GMP-specific phosphodiesterase class I)